MNGDNQEEHYRALFGTPQTLYNRELTDDNFNKLIQQMRGNSLHYEATGEYDLIDVIQDYKLNFNRGNIVKYVVRAGKKDDELQDLYKAKDYIEREITYIKELRTDKDKEWKD